ncbi:NAD(+) diphosphatase [Limibaculum sp. FT325]|uniref:NAD(+) diphosphatase n=1 Tax=Thermohalobaculum sediminis TaxID=2939436 RepID=UPI0020BD5316|nr:NAD(+) diphosphatase [Limibaculum sediminis]MCL5776576.1 NAD(+) diphosphatase [Limibaculum sediminis]
MTLSLPITFADGSAALDRAAHLRAGAAGLLAGAEARVLALAGGRPAIDLRGAAPALNWLAPADPLLAEAREAPVFLGLAGGAPCFAADVPAYSAEGPDPRLPEGVKFIDLRSVAAQLAPAESSIAATAKGVLGWHETHPRCARCGEPTAPDDGGWRRRCGGCGALHFPRTDPVVIMLVTDGTRVLLGRQSAWPAGLYSCLAGFMEPGETIEDAVRREVWEETRVRVGRVRYLACQPWPFPASLMLGCTAEALTDEITRDATELEDALWLPRAELASMLDGRHPRLGSPRADAIARVLLSSWLAGEADPV